MNGGVSAGVSAGVNGSVNVGVNRCVNDGVKVDREGELHQPHVLDFVAQLKGARGISILSTAIEGVFEDDAEVQMRIETRLREQRDAKGIRGFTQARPPCAAPHRRLPTPPPVAGLMSRLLRSC